MLSAAAVEAAVAEWFAIAKKRGELPEELAGHSELPRERPADLIKILIRLKTGESTGDLVWFDRLKCLFKLRNHLLHYQPSERPLGEFPPALEDCIRKHALTPGGGEDHDWTSRVLLPEVAHEASAIAREAVDHILDILVDEPPKRPNRPELTS